jgi:hypothetical protein
VSTRSLTPTRAAAASRPMERSPTSAATSRPLHPRYGLWPGGSVACRPVTIGECCVAHCHATRIGQRIPWRGPLVGWGAWSASRQRAFTLARAPEGKATTVSEFPQQPAPPRHRRGLRMLTVRQTFGVVMMLMAVAIVLLTSRNNEALQPFPLPPGMSGHSAPGSGGFDSDTPTVPPTAASTVSPSDEPTTPLPAAESEQTPSRTDLTATPAPESTSSGRVDHPCKPDRRCTSCTSDPRPTHPGRRPCPPTSTATP